MTEDAAMRRGSAMPLVVYQLLQVFPNLEEGHPLFRDADARAGLWVAAPARVSSADPEAPEAPEFHLIPFRQSTADAIEDSIDEELCLFLGEINGLRYFLHQVGLGHHRVSSPLGAGRGGFLRLFHFFPSLAYFQLTGPNPHHRTMGSHGMSSLSQGQSSCNP